MWEEHHKHEVKSREEVEKAKGVGEDLSEGREQR